MTFIYFEDDSNESRWQCTLRVRLNIDRQRIVPWLVCIGGARILDWGKAQTANSYDDVIRYFQKKRFFVGQRMKDQKLRFGLARNQNFAKGEELEPHVKKFYKNIKIGRRGKQVNATQTYHRQWYGGSPQSPEAMAVW